MIQNHKRNVAMLLKGATSCRHPIFGPFAVPFQQVALEPAGFRLPSLSVLLPPFYAMRKYRRLHGHASLAPLKGDSARTTAWRIRALIRIEIRGNFLQRCRATHRLSCRGVREWVGIGTLERSYV